MSSRDERLSAKIRFAGTQRSEYVDHKLYVALRPRLQSRRTRMSVSNGRCHVILAHELWELSTFEQLWYCRKRVM